MVALCFWRIWKTVTDNPRSDGIARVHGMANVQAEELVEYVSPQFYPLPEPRSFTDSDLGSRLASRACA